MHFPSAWSPLLLTFCSDPPPMLAIKMAPVPPDATATVTLSPDGTDMARPCLGAPSPPHSCPRTRCCFRLRSETVPSALRGQRVNGCLQGEVLQGEVLQWGGRTSCCFRRRKRAISSVLQGQGMNCKGRGSAHGRPGLLWRTGDLQ